MDEAERRAAGERARREVLGDTYVERATAETGSPTAELQDLATRYAWGEIWTRPGLDRRTRRVLVIGTLIALRQWDQLRVHLPGALAGGGVTVKELREIVLQQAVYCGLPAAQTAMRILEEVSAGDSTPPSV